MSETELPTGRDSMERELGGRVPLPEWTPAPDEPKEYARGDAGIVDAANDQTQSRGSTEDPLDVLVDKRQPKEGGRPFYTTVEDAAHDLATYHQVEDATQAAENLNELAAGVDRARAWAAGAQQPQPDAQLSAQAETPQPIDSPQPEAIEQPSGVSPKVAAALADPEIRQAIEATIAPADQARQQYEQGLSQLTELAAAGVLAKLQSKYPTITGPQIPAAMQLLESQDPHFFAEIRADANRAVALCQASREVQAQQAQMEQAQLRSWAAQQDDAFNAATRNENKETIKAAAEEIVNFAKENGVSHEALGQLWATNPVLRSSTFQLMMLDAAKYRMAQRTATSNPHRQLPSVQRPGISQGAGERNVDLSELRNEFRKATGNEQLKLGARLQRLQRESRR